MRRYRNWLGSLPLGLAFVVLLSSRAEASPGKCDAPFALDSLCEAGKTVARGAKDVVTAPIEYAANSAVEMFTSWVSDSAQWILGKVVAFIDSSTSPSLESAWFTERYRFMIGLAALVLVPMLLIATIRAIVTQDLSQLLRSFFLYLPISILGTFVAVHLTQALLGATDAMSASVSKSIAGDASQIFDGVGETLSQSVGTVSPAAPSFVIFFGALLLIIGSFFVWIELLVRSAAVTAAVFFLPMILSGLVWPSAFRWTKRLVEILVALILSKFVIVAVISLATAALADPGGGGFGTVMGASALMLMAAFSPFALLKLIPMVEGAAVEHLQGVSRGAGNTVRPGGSVNHAVSVMRSKVGSQSSQAGAITKSALAAAGAAGAAGLAGVKAAQTAATAPGKRAERYGEMTQLKAQSPSDQRKSTSRAGGEVHHPPKSPKKPRPERD